MLKQLWFEYQSRLYLSGHNHQMPDASVCKAKTKIKSESDDNTLNGAIWRNSTSDKSVEIIIFKPTMTTKKHRFAE